MRMGSVPDDSTLSPTEGVSGKIATPIMVGHSDDETDEDGVMRLKKASGLMGCLRYKYTDMLNSHVKYRCTDTICQSSLTICAV